MLDFSESNRSVLTSGDKAVSFAELFFDLVFVFAITQVVHLMHGVFDWVHVGKAVLVFWLVWWAWTQFTWALNAAETGHPLIQIATLSATAIAFFMAVSVPESFARSSLWFSLAYVAGRGIGLMIYLWVSWQDRAMHSVVKTFSLLSLTGLVAVLVGGYLGGPMQYLFWGLAILLDVVAAIFGGKSDSWNLHPRHFAERHGLFIIIALGETLIIAAGAVSEEYWDGYLLLVSLLSVGITCCLWWIYFYRTKDKLEHSMAARTGADQSMMARDVYSLLHFPLLCGLIIYAFAIEESMLHPEGSMSGAAKIALSTGILIFSTVLGLIQLRAHGKFPIIKIIMPIIIGAIILTIPGITTFASLMITFCGLLLMTLFLNINFRNFKSDRSFT